MEVLRFARALVPLAAVALLGPTGVVRPPLPELADPPWDPPACRTAVAASAPTAGVAWFRMDAVLDAAGTLAGQRLTLGVVGGRARQIALPPESFASGPVRGVVLVGDDDGSRSRLRAIDPAAGCVSTIAADASVIRSAILDTDLGAMFEHRVDRATREDQGVWRRATRGGTAVRVLPGLAWDGRHGRTFSTDLRWASDGRLAVASCGELACRTRIVDAATGHVVSTSGTGPVLGVAESRVIAYDICPGFPCGVSAVDPATGIGEPIVAGAGPASVGGRSLVYERDGHLAALDLRTRVAKDVVASAGYETVRDGSAARAGVDGPRGSVLLESVGRPPDPSSVRLLDPASAVIEPLEVQP